MRGKPLPVCKELMDNVPAHNLAVECLDKTWGKFVEENETQVCGEPHHCIALWKVKLSEAGIVIPEYMIEHIVKLYWLWAAHEYDLKPQPI